MKLRFNKSKKTSGAFTLLEVLIAVGILSTAIIFIFRSFTAALASVRFSQNITLACYLAEAKFWEVERSYISGGKIPDPGKEKIQEKDFHWSYEILDTAEPDLKLLKLAVSWKENQREKEYPLEFFTYLPPKNP